MTTPAALEVPGSVHAVPPAPVRPAPVAHMASPGEYLTFRLGSEEYGVALCAIQEIRGYQAPTRIAVVERDGATRLFILLDIEHLVSDATLQAEFIHDAA